jgi:hypothetical protein
MSDDHAPMDERASRSRRSRLALRGLVVAAVLVVIVEALSSLSSTGLQVDVLGTTAVLAFTVVGAIILDRRPGEPVGRICLGVGVTYSVASVLRLIASFIDGLPGQITPTGAALAVIASTLASLALLLSGPLLISRFPSRSKSRWQRRAEDLLMVGVSVIVIAGAVRPGILDIAFIAAVPNPLGLDWIPGDSDALFSVTVLTYAAAYLVTGYGLIRRYRVGGPVVRAQVRWFAGSIAVSLGLLVLMIASTGNDALNGIAWVLWIVSLFLPPIAIAIAILRYRLYDIDRIVSNAIGYGMVTVVLSAVFVSVDLLLVAIFSQVVAGLEGNGIAVAAATLVAAALFSPVRQRVQRAVDQRFHRTRYDAERTVAGLSARLRDEVDISRLRDDILDVVVRSVEPEVAQLWLRRGLSR